MLPNAGPKSVIPWLLAVLLPALLAGCQTPAPRGLPDLRGGGTLPREVSAPPARLDGYRAPARLAGLDGDGTVSRPGEDGWRQWRFANADTRLRLTLYGLPGGWQDLSDTRIVSGHYGQLRQQRVNRVYNSADQSIRFVGERLFDLEGHVTASGAWLINRPDCRPLYETLLLTSGPGHFIRLEAASRDRDTTALLRLSKRALAEFRAYQGKATASSSGSVRNDSSVENTTMAATSSGP